MIPVAVLTGFLGAGKTTLLKRILRDPAWADSAVIVNEFGEVPLDHDLLAVSDETFVSATTGCVCCVLRSDLGATLLDLARRRAAGEIPGYARVLFETSGLADPAPILHALIGEPGLTGTHRLDCVATLVESVSGAATLAHHPEAQRQVMLADRVVLTKPDLAPDTAALRDAIAALNPAAPITQASFGALDPAWLFAPAERAIDPEPWLGARHTAGVATSIILREAPLPALALTLWLQALAEHAGPRLLRVKGLVELAESPGRPVALHAVQHLVHPLEWLDQWPSEDHRGRIVLIGERLPPHWPARLLAAIEDEVRDASAG